MSDDIPRIFYIFHIFHVTSVAQRYKWIFCLEGLGRLHAKEIAGKLLTPRGDKRQAHREESQAPVAPVAPSLKPAKLPPKPGLNGNQSGSSNNR